MLTMKVHEYDCFDTPEGKFKRESIYSVHSVETDYDDTFDEVLHLVKGFLVGQKEPVACFPLLQGVVIYIENSSKETVQVYRG